MMLFHFRTIRWSLSVFDQCLSEPQTGETLGERRLGDPQIIPEAGEEAGSRPVWRSLDG